MAVNIQALTIATAITTVRVSVNHSVAGNNRFCLLHVGYIAGGTGVSAALDATAMTKETSVVSSTRNAALFSLTNVSAGSLGLSVTFQATATAISFAIINFTSADQTTPIGVIHSHLGPGGTVSAHASAAPGDIAMGFISTGDASISAFGGSTEFDLLSSDSPIETKTMGRSEPGDNTLRVFRWGDIAAATESVGLGVQIRMIQASAAARGRFSVSSGVGPTRGEAGVTDPITSVGDEGTAVESLDNT